MRICLVHQYYKTPKSGGAIRSYYIAHHLKKQGHEVVVITAQNDKGILVDDTDGFEVHYLPVYYENHLSFFSRIHAFYRYVRAANQHIDKLVPFDLLYVITTPLTTGFIAIRALKRYGIPYIFEVGDLWPEAPIQLGVIKNPIYKRIAYRLEKRFYSNARALIGLSPSITDHLKAHAPGKPVITLTNFADKDMFSQERQPSSQSFTIGYLGTMGMANHLEFLLDAAESLAPLDVKIILVGRGARKESLQGESKKRGLTNVTFIDHQSKADLKVIMQGIDALYISFKDVPVLNTGSPNKFFDALAAGKMVIINFEGWIKDLVEQHALGIYYPPHQPELLADKLLPYLQNRGEVTKAQQNAEALAATYSPKEQLLKLDHLLAELKL